MNDKGEYIQLTIFDLIKNQKEEDVGDDLGCPPNCPIGVTCSNCPYNN